MSYDDSFLTRAIADVREAVDEPTINAKYSDTRIMQHIEKSYILVLNEKNRCNPVPATVKQSITIVSGTTEYVLPYTMGTFIGLYDRRESGAKIFYEGRGFYNPFGRNVWLEEKTLHIQSEGIFGVSSTLIAE